MKHQLYVLIISIIMLGCSGGLNEEQRQQVKEGKADRAIRRITEAQIMEATLLNGEEIVKTLKNSSSVSSGTYNAVWLYDSMATTNSKMAELQEAYQYSKENNQPMPAHAELYSSDSLLFATPATIEAKDGIWFIFMDKKALVKSIK